MLNTFPRRFYLLIVDSFLHKQHESVRCLAFVARTAQDPCGIGMGLHFKLTRSVDQNEA